MKGKGWGKNGPPGDRKHRGRGFSEGKRTVGSHRGPGARRPDGEGGERAAAPGPPKPPPAGARLAEIDEIEVEVEKLVAGGDGLARVLEVPVFIPRSAPGDRLRIRLTERRADYGRAEIVEILSPGPGRRPDPHPELAATGTCDLQHIEDALQPRLKAAAVMETLVRLGGLKVPDDFSMVTGDPWGYRLRTAVDPVGGGVRVGYHARGSHEVVPLTRCALLVPELDELLARIPAALEGEPPHRIDLAAGDDGRVSVAPLIPGLPHGEVSTTVGEIVLSYDARTFFQGHRGLLPQLVERAVGPWEGDEAFDLYGGVGLFSLPLSRRYSRVTSVDGDPIAARFARNNARRNHAQRLEVVPQAIESWIGRLPRHPARVIVDPPRAGLTVKVRRALLASVPRRLTYVSCHAATLARDLVDLLAAYEVESLTLMDLFPQTGHMEAVVQLVERS
jgi:23S rRNA (uracil1939-C5)-methyltransferase